MTDTKALLELAARYEAATGADRELDAGIAMALGHAVEHRPGDDWFYAPETDGFGRKRVPAYSASLDAALMLVPEGWTRLTDNTDGREIVELYPPDYDQYAWQPDTRFIKVCAATPALALCAASLRAIAQEQDNA